MDSNDILLKSLREDITQNVLQLNAVIQDTSNCTSSVSELQILNSLGRSKISSLRKLIDKLGLIAKESKEPQLLKEVLLQREQLSKSMDAFKKANIKSMLEIEKRAKDELTKPVNEETALRQRQRRDKESLAKLNSNVTGQLLTVSRQLAETTKRSAETLDVLTVSSDNVTGTQQELTLTAGTISQSGKLLAKYGRREFTDKVLMFAAFAFFIACVFYIVQKRLF